MKLLPKETAIITTNMSTDEVSAVLRENTYSGRSLFRRPKELFIGHVDNRSFSIERVIRDYRNSFVPKVTGEIIPDDTGSRIEITLTLPPILRAFMRLLFGFGILLVMGIVYIAVGISSPDLESKFENIIPVLLIGFGYALPHFAFRFEVPKTKAALLKIVNGREEIGA